MVFLPPTGVEALRIREVFFSVFKGKCKEDFNFFFCREDLCLVKQSSVFCALFKGSVG